LIAIFGDKLDGKILISQPGFNFYARQQNASRVLAIV